MLVNILLVVAILIYIDYRFKKAGREVVSLAKTLGELSDKQTQVVVDFLVSKLKEKGIFNDKQVEVLFEELNKKIKSEVKTNEQIKLERKKEIFQLFN